MEDKTIAEMSEETITESKKSLKGAGKLFTTCLVLWCGLSFWAAWLAQEGSWMAKPIAGLGSALGWLSVVAFFMVALLAIMQGSVERSAKRVDAATVSSDTMARLHRDFERMVCVGPEDGYRNLSKNEKGEYCVEAVQRAFSMFVRSHRLSIETAIRFMVR